MLSPRSVGAGVLVAGYVLMLALNWPGQLSYDSIAQLHDGRTGIYNAWHPPVMAWLLGLFDAFVPGTGLYVLLVATLLYASLISIFWLTPKPSWLAIPVAAILSVLPQLLIYQGTVWKDVLFTDAALAGFICLALAASRWERTALRLLLLGKGVLLLVLAALARQNGLVALAFGICAIGTLAAMHRPGARLQAFAAYSAVSCLGAIIVFAAATSALATRTPGESGTSAQFRLLEDYDLVGAVKREPALKLDIVARANPDLAEAMREDGVPLYTPERNDTLATAQDLQSELGDTPEPVLAAQWRDLVFHHLPLYLGVRASVFAWTFATPDITRCYPFFVGVQGLPRYMRDLGLVPRTRPQDLALAAWGYGFVGTPVFSHITFAVLAIFAIVLLFGRRRPEDVAIAFLLLAALAFTLSFFVISIACDYRYLLFLDLSALAALLHLAADRPKIAGLERFFQRQPAA